MRRIIDGISYDTAQSRQIAAAGWAEAGQSTRVQYTLFETKSGSFFLHVRTAATQSSATHEAVIPLTTEGKLPHDLLTVLSDLFA
jgi:hypothetical protein